MFKLNFSQRLSEHICKLIIWKYMCNINVTQFYLFTYIMIMYFNMVGAGECRIGFLAILKQFILSPIFCCFDLLWNPQFNCEFFSHVDSFDPSTNDLYSTFVKLMMAIINWHLLLHVMGMYASWNIYLDVDHDHLLSWSPTQSMFVKPLIFLDPIFEKMFHDQSYIWDTYRFA
jgi:hypothetical protein